MHPECSTFGVLRRRGSLLLTVLHLCPREFLQTAASANNIISRKTFQTRNRMSSVVVMSMGLVTVHATETEIDVRGRYNLLVLLCALDFHKLLKDVPVLQGNCIGRTSVVLLLPAVDGILSNLHLPHLRLPDVLSERRRDHRREQEECGDAAFHAVS